MTTLALLPSFHVKPVSIAPVSFSTALFAALRDSHVHFCSCPQIVEARAVICYFAMRRLRFPASAIGAQPGATASGVSKATRRGEKLYCEDEVFQSFIG